MSGPITAWLSGEYVLPVLPQCIRSFTTDFAQQCLSTSESSDDTTLHLPSPTPLLRGWAQLKLASGSWQSALVATVNVSISSCSGTAHRLDTVALKFTVPRFTIYRALCDHLETLNQIMDATDCFHQMMSELGGGTNLRVEQAEWILGERSRIPCRYCCLCDHLLSDFKQRFSEKLECLGDDAMDAQQLDEAISEYSVALSLDPAAPQGLFIRRSKAYLASGLWEDALDDADEVCSFVSCGFTPVDAIMIRRSRSIHPLHGGTRGSTQLCTRQEAMTRPLARSRRCSSRYHSLPIQRSVV